MLASRDWSCSFLISSGSTALAATSSAQLVAKTPNAGVVLASFRKSDNAEKLIQELGSTFGAGEISLSILSAQIDDRPLYRVVAQADGVDSRELLQRMRSRGFDDAHIRSSQLSRRSLSAVSSRPAQPSGSVPTQAGMKKGLQEEKNIKTRAASGEHLLATSQRAAQPDPLAEFAGPGAQTVYGSEGGIDLNELQIQTLDHDAANVTIDGVIEEAVWRDIPYYDNMRVSIPDLGTPAKYFTKVRLFATEKGLYVSSDMEQPADSIVERITRRDDWVDRDTFGVTPDPPARPNWAIGSGSRWATATQTVRCCPSGVGNAIGTDLGLASLRERRPVGALRCFYLGRCWMCLL